MSRTTRTLVAAAALASTSGGLLVAAQPADAATTLPIGTVVATTLVGRQAPTTVSPRVAVADRAHLRKGDRVVISCKVHGETVRGNDIWYRIVSPSTEAWISARYVVNSRVLPAWCGGNNQRVTTVARTAVRQAPTTTAPVVRTVVRGVRMTAVCSVADSHRDNPDWYYTTDGNWVRGNGVVSAGPVVPCH